MDYNYLAEYINLGWTEGIHAKDVDNFLSRRDTLIITFYPQGVNYLHKEVGCGIDLTYQEACVRYYVEESQSEK